MAYGEYANSGRCLGRILHQLSKIGIPVTVVSSVILEEGGKLSYGRDPFATFVWTEDDVPVFTFVGHGADSYKQAQDRRLAS